MSSPRILGKRVAGAQDRLGDEARIVERAEELLFDDSRTAFRRVSKRRTRLSAVAAAAGVLLAGALFFYALWGGRSLGVRIDGQPLQVADPLWIPSEKHTETALAFSDGSKVRLGEAARARFVGISEDGAEILLEQGRLTADIERRPGARWKFYAGPFDVTVTGTRFDLSWGLDDGRFSVAMAEGSVVINAPRLAKHQVVRAGETFRAWVDEQRVEIASNALSPQTDDTPNMPTTPRLIDPSAPPFGTVRAPVCDDAEVLYASPDGDDATSDEEETAVASDAPQTPSKADAALDDGCTASSARVALGQADAARRQGALADAVFAYHLVRRCFGGSREAALSAFILGKIAFDRHRDWQTAAMWFARYLDEQRGEGPVREAMGRLMEAYVHGKDRRNARRTAARYLEKYPKGPHAAFAKSLVEEDGDFTADE